MSGCMIDRCFSRVALLWNSLTASLVLRTLDMPGLFERDRLLASFVYLKPWKMLPCCTSCASSPERFGTPSLRLSALLSDGCLLATSPKVLEEFAAD